MNKVNYLNLIEEYKVISKDLKDVLEALSKEHKNLQLTKIANAIQCEYCNEMIFSWSEHDFKMCGCGKTGIDGGLQGQMFRTIGDNYTWYPSFVIGNKKKRKDFSEVKDKTMELRNLVEKIKSMEGKL